MLAMRCLFEGCENCKSPESKVQNAVRYYSFPVTDYACDRLTRLAKKRLFWWCRICGVDHTQRLHQLAVCSKHFLKGSCAALWDIYDPDWVPSLYIPGKKRSMPSAKGANENDFIDNETLTEERITNSFWETNPDPVRLRIELIDEIIAYPIGRAYAILHGQNRLRRNYGSMSRIQHDVTDLPEELRNCLTHQSLSSMPRVAPELFSSNAKAVTIVNLALQPRWETERTIMKLQHSVLELLNLMEE
ncbi:uncharacterized protein LOC118457529 isoform X2 [Anopheles albimanus]|uniref:uncharacterized protein LOC118457529 isoform X2 n=1 Tax=Anopheles albimanus TaxID=7167 RepID=UPI00163F4472|nr:uncharacterized protein LOC118457529 isoform X2 [Anopheles albimanus]